MQRRDLLKAFGAATALALVPEHEAIAAWARVATGWPGPNGLSDAQLTLIGAVADTILPRSDSPSATDVKVPGFIDVIVSENYTDSARASFIAGLAELEAQLGDDGTAFVDQTPEHRAVAIGAIERLTNRRSEPASTYWRLKGLVIHGYFTSERVMKDVLHFQMMPGKFDGAAPVLGS